MTFEFGIRICLGFRKFDLYGSILKFDVWILTFRGYSLQFRGTPAKEAFRSNSLS
jgi:hypothetical protein